MKVAVTLAAMLLLPAGLVWAEEPVPAAEVVDAAEIVPVAESDESSCAATQSLPENELQLTEWAVGQGFAEVLAKSEDAPIAPACPAIISCNSTHCIETSLCAVRDTNSNTCCTGFGCLICPPGQTVQVQRCRCAGGGCLTANSQTFFCA